MRRRETQVSEGTVTTGYGVFEQTRGENGETTLVLRSEFSSEFIVVMATCFTGKLDTVGHDATLFLGKADMNSHAYTFYPNDFWTLKFTGKGRDLGERVTPLVKTAPVQL